MSLDSLSNAFTDFSLTCCGQWEEWRGREKEGVKGEGKRERGGEVDVGREG